MQRHTHRLELQNDEQPAKPVEFEVVDAVPAPQAAHGEARQEAAEPRHDDGKLCTISRGKEGSFSRLLS